MTDPNGAGRKMLTFIGGILMGSMAHHFFRSTMDPSWDMIKNSIAKRPFYYYGIPHSQTKPFVKGAAELHHLPMAAS